LQKKIWFSRCMLHLKDVAYQMMKPWVSCDYTCSRCGRLFSEELHSLLFLVFHAGMYLGPN
jgi:hypothetical protein